MSVQSPDIDLLALPDDATVNRVIEDYAREVREAYGLRVKGIYLFGSRARGDHRPTSDADIVVVLADENWNFWKETKRLADIAYDFIVSSGAGISAWPVPESGWKNPESHADKALFIAMQTDAQSING